MRETTLTRKTKETDISLTLNLDGGEVNVNTGVGFFDHMLTAFAAHAGFGLVVDCKGDIEVDCHHTVEDIGIVLGKAFFEVLGDKSNIARYGSFFIPMDEALGFCAVDICNREYLVFEAYFPQEKCGDFCRVNDFDFWPGKEAAEQTLRCYENDNEDENAG
jgi:imidazoleglycerol-phosphate dehydratase